MEKLIIKYKLINHTKKTKILHTFYVNLPPKTNLNTQITIKHAKYVEESETKNLIDHIKKSLDIKTMGLWGSYKYVSEDITTNTKNIQSSDNGSKLVKFYVIYCLEFTQGKAPCDDTTIHTYRLLDGTHTHVVYDTNKPEILSFQEKTFDKIEPESSSRVPQEPTSRLAQEPATVSTEQTPAIASASTIQEPSLTNLASQNLVGGRKLNRYRFKNLNAKF